MISKALFWRSGLLVVSKGIEFGRCLESMFGSTLSLKRNHLPISPCPRESLYVVPSLSSAIPLPVVLPTIATFCEALEGCPVGLKMVTMK